MGKRVFRSESDVIEFGTPVAELLHNAAKIDANRKWDIWDWIFGPGREGYVTYLNWNLESLPDKIELSGAAAREAARFVKGVNDLGLAGIELFTFLASIYTLNPVGAVAGFSGILRHGSKKANFESSSRFNFAFAAILKTYRLASPKPPKFVLSKGTWSTSVERYGGMTAICANGISLPDDWNVLDYL